MLLSLGVGQEREYNPFVVRCQVFLLSSLLSRKPDLGLGLAFKNCLKV